MKVNKSFFSVGTFFCVYMRLMMCEKDLGLAFARCYGGAFVCVSSRLAPLLGLWAGALEDGWGNFWDDCAVWGVCGCDGWVVASFSVVRMPHC